MLPNQDNKGDGRAQTVPQIPQFSYRKGCPEAIDFAFFGTESPASTTASTGVSFLACNCEPILTNLHIKSNWIPIELVKYFEDRLRIGL
ncbi:hypothetical protein TNCV_4611241 [Trichonephila clavipes]|nr:hypothetical protein TNCV_4611241 [Trichonephila clavipes]